MARKRTKTEHDDLTFASIPTEEDKGPRRRKATAEAPMVDPIDQLAAECPCRVSAEEHRGKRVHVRTATVNADASVTVGPVLCLPSAPCPMPAAWRTTDAYRRVELSGHGVR